MKSILIRDIDQKTLYALKRLARAHNRSLQRELHEIVERAAAFAPTVEPVSTLDIITVKTEGESTWRREEIYGDEAR